MRGTARGSGGIRRRAHWRGPRDRAPAAGQPGVRPGRDRSRLAAPRAAPARGPQHLDRLAAGARRPAAGPPQPPRRRADRPARRHRRRPPRRPRALRHHRPLPSTSPARSPPAGCSPLPDPDPRHPPPRPRLVLTLNDAAVVNQTWRTGGRPRARAVASSASACSGAGRAASERVPRPFFWPLSQVVVVLRPPGRTAALLKRPLPPFPRRCRSRPDRPAAPGPPGSVRDMRAGVFLAHWPWFSPEERVSLGVAAPHGDRAAVVPTPATAVDARV